jgi:hypothetical protein
MKRATMYSETYPLYKIFQEIGRSFGLTSALNGLHEM